MNYKQISKGIGWLIFSISFLVYLLTAESSVSFWDCGEFISAAYKLQITHPSGAPLYQLLGLVFSLFSFGNVNAVAFCINILSAVSSSFCVLLTYLITIKLAEKIINPLGVTLAKHLYIAIWCAGVIASFTLAFSDTFWFSAVEAEVYSLSSLFTFLTFWAALKWEENKSSVFHLRWLLFIASIVGLSIGIHLLNLLVIPAVVLLIYISVYGYSFFKTIKALILGVGILLTLQFLIIPGVPFLAFLSDKWAVNALGFKIGSGALLFIFGILVLFSFLIFLTNKYRLYEVNITLLCLFFVLIGYSSYMLVPIRAAAQPPININKPDNAASFLAYINRDQYGKRSLVHGPAFNAPIEQFKKGKAIWRPNAKGDYNICDYQTEYVFAKEYTMWFPRMGNVFNENSVDGYVGWTGVDKEAPPSQLKNWEFFFKYQFLHMYVRYHLWNFAGRQNDSQGHGNAMDGNSESGIVFIDNLISAPTDGLPKSLENKGKNHYYFLPLLLGLVGLFYHAKRQKQSFLPTLVLFLFTGVFLCFYLNVPPFEPRERDYAFVGSFQVFSIWVGLGAFGFMLFLHKWLPKGIWIGAIVSFIASPFLLLSQNWDDHNRSNRSFAKDYAYNFLKDLAHNAIVFVHGDNDTYPLWYIQNVEGFRTDVRVVNANLLGSDWGTFELTKQQYQSKPFVLSLNPYLYQQGKRSIVKVNNGAAMPIKKALYFVANDSNTITLSSGKLRCFLPSNNLVLESGDTITIRSTHLYRSDLAILDVVANNPNRPVYFSSRSLNESAPFFSDYLVNEGLVNRLYINKENKEPLALSSILSWRLSGFDDKTTYIDYEAKKVGRHYLSCISRQLNYFIENNEYKKAGELAVFCSKTFPVETTNYGSYSNALTIVNALYLSSEKDYANEYANQLVHRLMQEANYYSSIKNTIADYSARKELKNVLKTLKKLKSTLSDNQQNQKAMEIEKFLAFFAERNNK